MVAIVRREILLSLAITAFVMCAIFLPLDRVLEQVQQWASESPKQAVWLVGATFILAVMLLLPVSPIVMLAGFMFGLVNGLLLVWTVGFISSTLAFWVGRRFARPWVERRLRRRTALTAADHAIARNGLMVVLLARLSLVIPFGPLNYSLSLTGVKFRDYLLATNIGMIPAYFLPVYLGMTASDVAAILGGDLRLSSSEWAASLAFMVSVFAVIGIVVRLALVKLRQEISGSG